MIRLACILLALPFVVGASSAFACVLQLDKDGQSFEKFSGPMKVTPRERTDRPIDVTEYDLDLTVTTESEFVTGTVVVTLEPLENALAEVVLDLANNDMTIGDLQVDGVVASYVHKDDLITIELDPPRNIGDSIDVEVQYSGTVQRDYGLSSFRGGYRVRHFPDENGSADPEQPIIATLSEPDAARAWWPCHDTPYDAATVRLSITMPDDMTMGAPGVRVADEVLGGGLRRQEFQMSAEIPSYLVSLAIAHYQTEPGQPYTWEDTAQVRIAENQPPVTMPVHYLVTAEQEEAARASWAKTPLMLEAFDEVLGPYPFADIKYGMATFVFGGAMEHPSMSSMSNRVVSTTASGRTGGPSFEWITAHELGHQWFGDSVRLPRWGEIWLNEGFASYTEVMWYEFEYGYEVGKQWLIDDKRHETFNGTVVDPELALFGTTVYRKGAWFLHMLRQVLGEDPSHPVQPVGLFQAMYNYANDPALRFGPATTADFQAHCEAILHDRGRTEYLVDNSLDWMFVPWLTREGRPDVNLAWRQSGNDVAVVVRQPVDRTYRLPLPVRFTFNDGTEEDLELWVEGAHTIANLSGRPPIESVSVDPEQDWLINSSVGTLSPGLAAPYPNPFNPSTTVEFFLEAPQRATLRVFDVRGRLVKTLEDGSFPAGLVAAQWRGDDENGRRVASGVYTVQLKTTAGDVQTRKATLVK